MDTATSGDADQSPTEGSKAAPPPRDLEARVAALRAEFPGWTITPHDTPPLYRAVKEGDDKGFILGAGSYAALWNHLARQDDADCERAMLALRAALEKHGARIVKHDVSLVVKTRTGVARSVGVLRGRFVWDSGLDLGPTGAVDEVTVKIVRLLGLELHPQLSVLARRMGVRGYTVDIGAPEITVTTAVGVSPPLAVRITCEPRPTDEDRDWFWTHWGDPIAEAGDITAAEVALVGLLADRP
ncbi:hypothetical protein [Actinomadura coerulea]|uniref:hypothetical protein n=1 Tax=Actinomadura coerulea TaxID=46159 RepID=UPI003438DF47